MKEEEKLKTYEVGLNTRSAWLTVTVKAKDEKDAIDQAYNTVETSFSSEDEKTDCEVKVSNVESVELIEPERET